MIDFDVITGPGPAALPKTAATETKAKAPPIKPAPERPREAPAPPEPRR
jgi:hypothetical protein